MVLVDGLVFDWGVHPETRAAASTVVEDLKILEDRVGIVRSHVKVVLQQWNRRNEDLIGITIRSGQQEPLVAADQRFDGGVGGFVSRGSVS